MEKTELEEVEIPRGGPIYIANMVSPLTRVPDFEDSVLCQLQELEAELCLDSSQLCEDDDLSVAELKVYTEEELVDMAMKGAFKDDENAKTSSKLSEECSNAGTNLERAGRGKNISDFESSTGSHSEKSCKEIVIRKKSRKRKQRKLNCFMDDIYIRKVEQLAMIKQKQDEDKAAARLHSLNSSCKVSESATPSSEKSEMMKSLRSTNSAKVKSSDSQEHVAVLYPETVMCVEVYHNVRIWVKFLVLGRQMLTELRDKIHCLTDQVMEKAGQHDPSGYFLIEDVFYNDLRDPAAIDYSKAVFDWLRNSRDEARKKWDSIINGELQQKQKEVLGSVSPSHLPRLKAIDMHKTRFCDLRFVLGAGYLCCHQGDCKHTIVIRDMRLIHQEDVQNRAAYPILIFQLKPRRKKCNVCRISRATKVTVDDKWAEENPCYFCDYCYSLLHSHSGDYNLSMYDYLHD